MALGEDAVHDDLPLEAAVPALFQVRQTGIGTAFSQSLARMWFSMAMLIDGALGLGAATSMRKERFSAA